jgi:3' terminal RNA ribose 2'-O-methyltransferase Hen1
VDATSHPLDEANADWGPSRYYTVTLRARRRLSEVLSHLYVLVPVLDDDKHYWVGDDEVEKLVRRGEGWLAGHPERESIAHRYLKHKRSLTRLALERLLAEELPEPEETERACAGEESALEAPIHLNDQRLGTVLAVVKQAGAKRVLDLGCGEGKLLRLLLEDRSFDEIVGVDVSARSLEIAAKRLRLDRLPELQRKRLTLLQGSLTYRDRRLEGYDAAALVEVIEHIDPSRLGALERTVFEFARPARVVVTTPNSEYNVRFESLPPGRFRHRDHRFEWTRSQFEAWAKELAGRRGYAVRFLPVGPDDPAVGAPTQMALFSR